MTYSIDIINLFINKYINNCKLSEISSNLQISRQTLQRWVCIYKNNIENKSLLKDKDFIKSKRSTNKKEHYKKNIIDYVNKNEGCSLDDIYNHINKEISKSSLCRILKDSNISRKRCNIRVICKDINKIE